LIRVIAGPHEAPPLPEEWEVTSEMNRIGIRLRRRAGGGPAGEPPALHQTDALHDLRELPSCGMQFGTLQWHPDGSLVAMGPDHPVTGGYLQPATVISEDLWKLAQLAPGDRIRFEVVGED
jgi:urea carboxylase